MKAKRVKTPETTEEVSSHGVEKRAERHKCQRSAPFAREKRRADWKKDLQTCGEGRESRKRPKLVVGQKPNGKSQMKSLTSRTRILATSMVVSVMVNFGRGADAGAETDLDKLVGQPVDIAPSAYQYRADRKAEDN